MENDFSYEIDYELVAPTRDCLSPTESPDVVHHFNPTNTDSLSTDLPNMQPPNFDISNVDRDTLSLADLPNIPPNFDSSNMDACSLVDLASIPMTATGSFDFLNMSGLSSTDLPNIPPSFDFSNMDGPSQTDLPSIPTNFDFLNKDHLWRTGLPNIPPNFDFSNIDGLSPTDLPNQPPIGNSNFLEFLSTQSVPPWEPTCDIHPTPSVLRTSFKDGGGGPGGFIDDVRRANPQQLEFSQLYTPSQYINATSAVVQPQATSSSSSLVPIPLQFNQSKNVPPVGGQAPSSYFLTNQGEGSSSRGRQVTTSSAFGPSHEPNQDASSLGAQHGLLPYGSSPSPTETQQLLGVNAPVNISASLSTQPQCNAFSPAFVQPPSISTMESALDYLIGCLADPMLRQSFVQRNLVQDTTSETSNPAFPQARPTTMVTEDSESIPVIDKTTPRDQRTKRRRKYDDGQREKIKHVRKQGACTRCRLYKEPCDSKTPCESCLKVQATAKIFRFPCQKPNLHTVVPFRLGNARAGERHSTFPQLVWYNSEPERTTYISKDFLFRCSRQVPSMPLRCRRFVPRPNDVLVEPYQASDGEIIYVQTPPFACVNIHTPEIRAALEAYIKDCQPLLIDDILTLANDDIYRLGLREAVRFASVREGSVVSLALEILACVYGNFKQSLMVGSDTLDVSPIDNEKFSIHGKSPVPSVLDYQIDTLFIHHMQDLMKKVAKSLNQLIFTKSSIANWYEIFLVIFVLLMSLEKVYMAQLAYVRRSPERLAADVSHYMISKWKSSAKSLLYHFRCVLRGMVPFSSSWDPKKQKQVKLDAMSLEYIETMSKILDQRKAELSALREEGGENSYARPLVWLVELFLN